MSHLVSLPLKSWRLPNSNVSRPAPRLSALPVRFGGDIFDGPKKKPPFPHITMGSFIDDIGDDQMQVFQKLLQISGKPITANIVQVVDLDNQAQLTLIKRDSGKPVFWFDFKDLDHPLLANLAEKFSFPPMQEQDPDHDQITFEKPIIDKDSVQLTAYSLKLNKIQGQINTQKLRIYIGEDFLVTTHDGANSNVETVRSLLTEASKAKSPMELMRYILGDVVNHNGGVIDSLSNDYDELTRMLDQPKQEKQALKAFNPFNQKINDIYTSVIRQKRVFTSLLSANFLHDSPLVPVDNLNGFQKQLDDQIKEIHNFQMNKDGLLNLYRAKQSNILDVTMRRLAALSILFGPPTVVGGFLGMNVPIPGSANPNLFWYLVGGATAISAGLFALMKKRRWI